MTQVSIVIPCYNAGSHLAEAVQSALAQTHADLEIIIVDDGSTDPATTRLLDEATWPRTLIIRQANGGPSAARNRAIEAATGKYILPLDADDTIEREYAAKAVAILETRPDMGVVYCRATKFGAEQGPWHLPAYTLRELVIDNVIFVTSMYRKADWEAVGGYNEKLRHGMEDYDFWVKMVHLGRDVAQLDEYLFNYRVQQESRTTSFQKGRPAIVETYAEIFRSNIAFYAAHAEVLFEHRFGLGDELSHWQMRYGGLEAFFNRHPRLVKALKRLKTLF